MALGYAGWSASQLHRELAGPGWMHVPDDEALLFDADAGERWTRAFAGAGGHPRLLSDLAGTA